MAVSYEIDFDGFISGDVRSHKFIVMQDEETVRMVSRPFGYGGSEYSLHFHLFDDFADGFDHEDVVGGGYTSHEDGKVVLTGNDGYYGDFVDELSDQILSDIETFEEEVLSAFNESYDPIDTAESVVYSHRHSGVEFDASDL